MKKILIPLFLIVTSMGIMKLSAYCVYNYSNDEKITIKIYPSKETSGVGSLAFRKANHVLSPKGDKACLNWKEIDSNNRKKELYWIAYKGGKQLRAIWTRKLGEGCFPIGGAILFFGYDKDARADFEIHFDNKKWKYHRSPWNHKSRPWETYKR